VRGLKRIERSITATSESNVKKKKFIKEFPNDIQDFASMFVQMQEKRHRADYDPNGLYYKSAVGNDIKAVRAIIKSFNGVDKRHRRAFVAYVVFDGPRT
jgi:hypothetical protein